MNVALQSINFSLKDIPIPSQNSYLKVLIQKTESFLKCLRWKAFFFDNPDSRNDKKTYGFLSQRTPPQNPSLAAFEDDMYSLIKSIEFRPVDNSHLKTLFEDLNSIKTSDSIFVKADKTSNLYKIEKQQYEKVLHDNITKSYKKATEGLKNEIDKKIP